MFSSVDPDAGCHEAIKSKTRPIQELSQNIVEANLQGKIADMRSGELRFAAGIANRENKFRYEPGGINDNVSIIEQPIGIFVSNNTSGETEVSEIYGELLLPATERLNLELGYRYSDYDRSGGVDTWKTLVDWSATDFDAHPRRLPSRDARAEHRGAVRGPALEHGRRLHLRRPVPGIDDRAVGQSSPANPNRLRRADPLPQTSSTGATRTRPTTDNRRSTRTAARPSVPAGPERLRAARPAVLPVRERDSAR